MDSKPAAFQSDHMSDEERYDAKAGHLDLAGHHGLPPDPDEGLSEAEKAKIVGAPSRQTRPRVMLTDGRTKPFSANSTGNSSHGCPSST